MTELQLISIIADLSKGRNLGPFYIHRAKKSTKYFMSVATNSKDVILYYNWEQVAKEEINFVVCSILHEFGHIKNKTQKVCPIKSEYLAEKYMLKEVKRLDGRLYNYIIKINKASLSNPKWVKAWPAHATAYSRLLPK